VKVGKFVGSIPGKPFFIGCQFGKKGVPAVALYKHTLRIEYDGPTYELA
jgi:hypothetical protein